MVQITLKPAMECAVSLIKAGKAYVCDLTQNEIREYRGTLKQPGKNSRYRDRSVEENLQLFEDIVQEKFQMAPRRCVQKLIWNRAI